MSWPLAKSSFGAPQASTTAAGSTTSVMMLEGGALTVKGNATAVGTVQQINSAGSVIRTWVIGANSTTVIGPYSGTQQLLITCTAGSIDASVGDAVVSGPSFGTDSANRVAGIALPTGGNVIERRPEWRKDNFRKKRFDVRDDMSAAVSGAARWTKFGGTATVTNSKDFVKDQLGCTNSLKISGLGSFASIQGALQSAIVPSSGTVAVHVYITEMPTDYSPTPPTPPTYQSAAIQILLCTDSSFGVANTATSMNITSQQFLRSGWNTLQLNSADDGTLNTTGTPAWTYGGSVNADTSYPYMRIVLSGFQPLATTTPVLYIGGVFQGGKGQAAVLMNFDDCHQDSIDLANLYRSYEIPVSLGVVTGTIGVGNQMSEAQLRTQYNEGTDLFAHTTDHIVLDTVSLEYATADMRESRDWMYSKGFVRTADVFAFPQNTANDRLLAAAKSVGFALSRWSRPGWTPTAQGIDNPIAIGSRDVGGKTLAQVKKFLDSAETYAGVQIIYGHQINTKGVTSMTHSAGVVTVVSNAHGYSNGNLVHHRGADQSEYNVAGILENVTTNGYTFKATMSASAATSANGMRSFSPDFPVAGSAAPANSLYWNWSDHIALCKDIADRITAGTLVAINFSTLLDRCRV